MLLNKTIAHAKDFLGDALTWYFQNGFNKKDFERRALGWKVEKEFFHFEPKTTGSNANYFTCMKDADGFAEVANIGAKSANLIKIGPGANALNQHVPAFRLGLAHELSHVVQNNRQPGAAKKMKVEGWVQEATADAVGVLHVQDYYGKTISVLIPTNTRAASFCLDPTTYR